MSLSVWADTVTVPCSADAAIREDLPTSSIGDSVDLFAGKLGDNADQQRRRSLLLFDLTGRIPAGAIVTSAVVQVTVNKIPPGQSTSGFELRRVLRSWTESGATWTWRSTIAAPWSQAGASGTADAALAASASIATSGTGTFTSASTPQLVSDVQDWLSAPASNFGWLLVCADEVNPQTVRKFASRESGDPATRPKLIVGYAAASPPPRPVIRDVAVAGGQFRFSFEAQAGRVYAVEFTTSVIATNWSALATLPAQPADTTLSFTNAVTGSPGFYRLRTP